MGTLTKEPEKKEEPGLEARQRLLPPNMGRPQRVLRMMVGLFALVGSIMAVSPLVSIVLAIIAFAGILTSVAGYCPINAACGIDTYRQKPK